MTLFMTMTAILSVALAFSGPEDESCASCIKLRRALRPPAKTKSVHACVYQEVHDE
jgi:hypothetical protein